MVCEEYGELVRGTLFRMITCYGVIDSVGDILVGLKIQSCKGEFK